MILQLAIDKGRFIVANANSVLHNSNLKNFYCTVVISMRKAGICCYTNLCGNSKMCANNHSIMMLLSLYMLFTDTSTACSVSMMLNSLVIDTSYFCTSFGENRS